MPKYFVGCSGWEHARLISNFYSAAFIKKDYLQCYSRIFDLVLIDLPLGENHVLKSWAEETPGNFRFIIKVPRLATDPNLFQVFLEGLGEIREKVLAIFLQVPSSLRLLEGRNWLEDLLRACSRFGYSAVVGFGNSSWYQDITYNILRKYCATILWSDRNLCSVITNKFVAIELTGDNELEWINKLKEKSTQETVEFAAVIVDNPGKVNRIMEMLGLPERKPADPHSQSSLDDETWQGRVIMCVDLNAFYPSCEELREHTLIGKPHAVVMTDQKDKITKGVISSCSYEARKFGIRSAMPLATALGLCQELVLRPVDIAYYQQVSEKVMTILQQFSDVFEQASIDEAFMDCTACAGSHPYQHAVKIKTSIKQQCGLLTSIGIASSKSIAKIASDFKKPDGLTSVHPDRTQVFLAPLDVARISGVGSKTQHSLNKMGIEKIGQLASCDVQRLTDRFGRNGLWMWRVANGLDEESVQQREEHVSLSTEQTLDEATRERDRILVDLNDLVDEIYNRLVRHGYMFRTVGIKLVKTNFAIETHETSYNDPQEARASISSVIEQLLDRCSISDSTHAIRKVGLRVTNLVSQHKGKARTQKTMLDY